MSSATLEWEDWDLEVQKDVKLSSLIQDLLVDPTTHTHYELKKGRLYYQGKLVLPQQHPRISTIIKELHESPLGGHSGYFRTFKRIVGVLNW